MEAFSEDKWIPTVCYMCYSHCGMKVRRQNGLLVDIKGDENNPHGLGKLCAKGKAAIMGLYDPYRVKTPLKRTNPEKGIGVDPKWVEITWAEALDEIVERLKKVRQEDPRKLVLAGLDFRSSFYQFNYLSAFGSPNLFHAAAQCGNVLHTIHWMMTGSFFAEVDYSLCNYCLFVGSQEGFMVNKNSSPMSKRMADARERGMKLVVIDPVCSHAACKADEWIPIRPGTDAFFALALLNVLVNELAIYDAQFIKKYTNGPYLIGPDGQYCRDKETGKPLIWDEADQEAKPYDNERINEPALEGTYQLGEIAGTPAFQLISEHLTKYPPEAASEVTTIPAASIRRIAREFGEAARIGSIITIEGQQLPYRPAALQWTRGADAHKSGTAAGFALQLVNVIIGAVDMPGGLLGNRTKGPSWSPSEGPDGLIVAAGSSYALPYPPSRVTVPEHLDLTELFPVACGSHTPFEEGVLNPEKYHIAYQPEIMLHINSNVIMTTWDPKRIERAFKRIPFFVSISYYLNETTEFADLVLPDTHFLETLMAFPNYRALGMMVGPGPWYWPMAQPVVEPSCEAKDWTEVLLCLAERVGFADDFWQILNLTLNLKEPYRLLPGKHYSYAEIADNWAKSFFGPEHDLAWFKQNGVIKVPKKVEETYPRPFFGGRIPIYLEHYIKAGQELQRVTKEMGLEWDTSDYVPLPGWRPCPAYEERSPEYDLYAVNFKVPFHTFSFTAQNPWLDELAQYHPYGYEILINAEVAKKKEVKEGDFIWVESAAGKVRGRAKPTECIHPEVLGIPGAFGHWVDSMPIAKGKGAHFNSLLSGTLDRIDMLSAAPDGCVKVKVYKSMESKA